MESNKAAGLGGLAAFTFKKRPGPEQVSLKVRLRIPRPGSWFKGLNPAERRERVATTG